MDVPIDYQKRLTKIKEEMRSTGIALCVFLREKNGNMAAKIARLPWQRTGRFC